MKRRIIDEHRHLLSFGVYTIVIFYLYFHCIYSIVLLLLYWALYYLLSHSNTVIRRCATLSLAIVIFYPVLLWFSYEREYILLLGISIPVPLLLAVALFWHGFFSIAFLAVGFNE